MFETFKTGLIQWNQRTDSRQKLQHSYVALLAMCILLAGIVSLFSGTRSRQLMYIALALITTFVTNFLVWSLLKTSVLDKLPRQVRATTRSARPTRR